MQISGDIEAVLRADLPGFGVEQVYDAIAGRTAWLVCSRIASAGHLRVYETPDDRLALVDLDLWADRRARRFDGIRGGGLRPAPDGYRDPDGYRRRGDRAVRPWEPDRASHELPRYDKLQESDVDGLMFGWLFFTVYERITSWRRPRRFARRSAIRSRP